MSYNEIANTDLIKVFGLILKAAIDNDLPQSELPETIYVISDMEFDAGVCDNISLHEEVKELFNKYGYVLPNIVYWNVDFTFFVLYGIINILYTRRNLWKRKKFL